MKKLFTFLLIILVVGVVWLVSLKNREVEGITAHVVEIDEYVDASSNEDGLFTYVLDTDLSSIAWVGKKITGFSEEGTVKPDSGWIQFDQEGNVLGGSFEIDMRTVNSTNLSGGLKESLETHLMSDDFFAVETYPSAVFTIRSVEGREEGGTNVTGNLTLKGITQEITFPAMIVKSETIARASATFSIDRTLWGVRYGSGKFFEGLGDNLIKDEIELSLDLVAGAE